MTDYIYEEESYQIIGILFEVHKNLGKGFSEIVYKDALEYEYTQLNIPFEREREYVVTYKDSILKHKFYADFIVYDEIILEVKSVKEVNNEHIAQTLNYMKLADSQLGIIANFQNKSLTHKRLVL